MRNAFSQSPTLRPVSVGYLVTFGFALVGLTFLGIGLGAILEARAGHDPMDGINAVGLPCLLFSWLLMYIFRLIFWRRVPEHRQAQARGFVTAVLVVEVVVTGLAIALLMSGADVVAVASTGVAAVCQIATVIWLVRYRKE